MATQPLLVRLTTAQRAALKDAAANAHCTESAYLRRALSITLRLDAMTEETAAYQTWLRDGLADLYAAANAAATLSHAALAALMDHLNPTDSTTRRTEMEHRLAQSRTAIPNLDLDIPWHPPTDPDDPALVAFWAQVQGRRKGT